MRTGGKEVVMPLISLEISNQVCFPDYRKQAMARAQKALLVATELDDHELVAAWATIGECHKFDKEPELAEEAYLKALEIVRALNDQKLLGEGYLALGDALHFCQEYTRAITYYDQAAEIFKRLNDTEQLELVLSQAAYACAKNGRRDEERQYLQVAILQPTVSPESKGMFLERIALSLGASERYQGAIQVYEEALDIYTFHHFRRFWEERLRNLAKLYVAVGDEQAAQRTLARTPPPYPPRKPK